MTLVTEVLAGACPYFSGMRLVLILAGALAGCWAPAAEPPTLPGSIPPPCALRRDVYVIDQIKDQFTVAQADDLAVDLDGGWAS